MEARDIREIKYILFGVSERKCKMIPKFRA